ncbi:MAG: YheV family putative metal-binding protein [Glaciecola sp.]
MSNKQRKRFIAGATCPQCRSIDSIMLYFENSVTLLTQYFFFVHMPLYAAS